MRLGKERSRLARLRSLVFRSIWGFEEVTGRGVNAVDVAEFRGPHCHRRW